MRSYLCSPIRLSHSTPSRSFTLSLAISLSMNLSSAVYENHHIHGFVPNHDIPKILTRLGGYLANLVSTSISSHGHFLFLWTTKMVLSKTFLAISNLSNLLHQMPAPSSPSSYCSYIPCHTGPQMIIYIYTLVPRSNYSSA
jgi:hypothetical protein